MHVSLTVKIPSAWSSRGHDLLRQRLRRTWQALRFRFPSIGLAVEDERLVYKVPSTDDLETWSTASLHIYDKEENVTYDAILAKDGIPEIPHLHAAIKSNTSSSSVRDEVILVFRAAHHFADGLSGFATLNKFMTLLAQPADPSSLNWGEEVSRLPPSLEEAASSPAIASPESVARVEKVFSGVISTVPSLGLSCDAPSTAKPSSVLNASMKLSRKETDSIVSVCKSRGIPITAAAMAALVQVQYDRLDPNSPLRERPWSGSLAVNMRSMLPSQPENPDAYLSAPYVSATFLSVDPRKGFDAAANDAASFIKSVKSPHTLEDMSEWARQSNAFGKQSKLYSIWKVFSLAPLAVLSLIFSFLTGKFPAATGVSLSSLGVMDGYVASRHRVTDMSTDGGGDDGRRKEEIQLEVDNLKIDLQIHSKQVGAFMWTWQGQLELSCGWNSGFYDAGLGMSLLREWKEVLMEKLDLSKTST